MGPDITGERPEFCVCVCAYLQTDAPPSASSLSPACEKHGCLHCDCEYTQEQLGWLEAIRDHLAANIEVSLRDFQDFPQFTARGGVIAARKAFGPRLETVIGDVTEALVA